MNAGHTPGPLMARQINTTDKPFAVISPNGLHGEEIVGGYMHEADAVLFAAAPDLLAALVALEGSFEKHRPKEMWDAARAAIARATGAA